MGGKSKTSQTTQSTQATTNIVNDGEYAGASGVTIDESETDNSIEDSYNQDIDKSIEDSFNKDINQEYEIDNSVSNEYDYSREIDNNGEYSGNTGTINVLDGGAIDAAFSLGEKVIDELSDSVDSTNAANAGVIKSLETTTKENNRIIADLAKSTALQGQDIIAKSVVDVARYFAFAAGGIGASVVLVLVIRRFSNA